MTTNLKVSVIVPTFNGLDNLKILLPTLGAQIHQPHEVVIVLDGSTDGSFEWINHIKQACHYKFRLNIINQTNKGRGAAKSVGARIAVGDIIIFCDDDMFHYDTWIQSHLNAHQSSDIVTGPVLSYRAPRGSNEFFQYFTYISKGWQHEHDIEGAIPFTSANVSFKSHTYFKTRGFSDSLNDAEDREYSLRLFALGFKIRFEHNCKSRTACYLNFREYSKRLRQYNTAKNQLIDSSYHLHTCPSIQPLIIVKSIIHGFKYTPSIHALLAFMLDSRLLLIFPKPLRYSIYTAILF